MNNQDKQMTQQEIRELFIKWRKGKTLQQAGEELGVHRSTILRYERGDIPIPYLVEKFIKGG